MIAPARPASSYTNNWPHETAGRQPHHRRRRRLTVSIISCWPASRPWSGGAARKVRRHRQRAPADDPLLRPPDAVAARRDSLHLAWSSRCFFADRCRWHQPTLRHRRRRFLWRAAVALAVLRQFITHLPRTGIFWIATAWLAAGSVCRAQHRRASRPAGWVFAVLAGRVGAGRRRFDGVPVAAPASLMTPWLYIGHSGYEYRPGPRRLQIALLIGCSCGSRKRKGAPSCWRWWRKDENHGLLLLFVRRSGHRRFTARGVDTATTPPVDRRILALVGRTCGSRASSSLATVVFAFPFARQWPGTGQHRARRRRHRRSFCLAGIIGAAPPVLHGPPPMIMALGSVFSAGSRAAGLHRPRSVGNTCASASTKAGCRSAIRSTFRRGRLPKTPSGPACSASINPPVAPYFMGPEYHARARSRRRSACAACWGLALTLFCFGAPLPPIVRG